MVHGGLDNHFPTRNRLEQGQEYVPKKGFHKWTPNIHYSTNSQKYHHCNQKGRKGAGVKGAGVANCRVFRSAVPSVVVWSILLVSLCLG